MNNLLMLFSADEGIIPVVFFLAALGVIFISVFSKGTKITKKGQDDAARRQHQQQTLERTQSSRTTSSQGQYSSQQRSRQAQRQQTSSVAQRASVTHPVAHDHDHIGQEAEAYEEIIGSLGDISDEGCDELSGVRLIAHDLAYAPEKDNSVDYDKIARALVLGDVLNSPRYKVPYSRKRK